MEVVSIGAVAAVYLDATSRGDEAEDLVAIDGVATLRQQGFPNLSGEGEMAGME